MATLVVARDGVGIDQCCQTLGPIPQTRFQTEAADDVPHMDHWIMKQLEVRKRNDHDCVGFRFASG